MFSFYIIQVTEHYEGTAQMCPLWYVLIENAQYLIVLFYL